MPIDNKKALIVGGIYNEMSPCFNLSLSGMIPDGGIYRIIIVINLVPGSTLAITWQ